VALQVVGRFFDESRVLRVAAAYEAAAGEAVSLKVGAVGGEWPR
jgi:Asp-tRNA(Asn)/Glu-tRNA(Gln) amidotransferase A subunit family amidase